MSRRPRRQRDESPPRSARRSSHRVAISRTPPPRSSREGSPPALHVPVMRPGFRPVRFRRDRRGPPVPRPVRVERPVPSQRPGRKAVAQVLTPIWPCAWPGRIMKPTGHPGAAAALRVRPPSSVRSPGLRPPLRRTSRTRRRKRARRPPEAAGAEPPGDAAPLAETLRKHVLDPRPHGVGRHRPVWIDRSARSCRCRLVPPFRRSSGKDMAWGRTIRKTTVNGP